MRIGLTVVTGMMFGAMMSLMGSDVAMAGNMPGWSAPAVQQPATQRQLKRVAPSSRAGNRLRSIATRSRPNVSPFQTWEQLWAVIWRSSRASAPVQAAATVRSQPICQGDMNRQIDSIVVQTVRAINAGRDGDAARLLARFQDKLMCLDVKSMWTLDFLMAAFMANASMLPPLQRDQAIKGALNLALLVFDQIQYTGRSFSLPVFYHMRGHIQRALTSYSGRELGLWFYDYQSGAMQRYTFDRKQSGFSNGLMAMLSGPGRFANGACSITEMVGQGFKCGGIPGSKSGGGGGGMPSSGGSGQLACMTAAASMSGMRGQMRCMAKAGGGGNSVGSWMARARPAINMQGVLDDFCSGRTGDEPATPGGTAQHGETPGFWDWVFHPLDSAEKVWSAGTAGQEATSEQKSGSTMETNMDCLMNLDPDTYESGSCTTVTLANFGSGSSSNRPVDGAVGGSGSCGASTNAVARANSLFSCTSTGGGRPGSGGSAGPLAGQNAPGTRSMPAPGSSGGGGGGMSGLMSCAVQGGSLVRTSLNDSRCQQSMCAPGQSCSCNGVGGSAPAEVRGQVQRSIFSPNRSNIGARDPRPNSGVGGAPRWGGVGGPTSNPLGGKNPAGGR